LILAENSAADKSAAFLNSHRLVMFLEDRYVCWVESSKVFPHTFNPPDSLALMSPSSFNSVFSESKRKFNLILNVMLNTQNNNNANSNNNANNSSNNTTSQGTTTTDATSSTTNIFTHIKLETTASKILFDKSKQTEADGHVTSFFKSVISAQKPSENVSNELDSSNNNTTNNTNNNTNNGTTNKNENSDEKQYEQQ